MLHYFAQSAASLLREHGRERVEPAAAALVRRPKRLLQFLRYVYAFM